MIEITRAVSIRHVGGILAALPLLLSTAVAQPMVEPPPVAAALDEQSRAVARSDTSTTEQAMPMPPSDVLTPDRPAQTPSLKIGIRCGVNRSSYSNDRYLDNEPLDVGEVSGETDVYSTAAGFGYNIGLQVENPLNAGLSTVATLEYVHATFGSVGPVEEPCLGPDSTVHIGTSQHQYSAQIDYVKAALGIRINFRDFYLVLGLTGEHPVRTHLQRRRSFEESGCVYPDTHQPTIEESGAIPDPNGLHYALRVAAGLSYRIGERIEFSPELNLDFGMNAINKSPQSDLGIYSINAIIRFDL